MARIPGIRRSFRLPWRSSKQVERDVEEELRFHLEMRTWELVAAGMPEEVARDEARRQFGDLDFTRAYCADLDRRRVRRARLAELLEELRQDVGYAVRQLAHAPAFTAATVLTLALGIGATSAIFSAVNGVLLQPLPFREPERLVQLFVQMPGLGIPPGPFSEPELADLRRDGRTFETLGAVRMRYASLTGAGDPERVRAAFATADLFRVMGVSAALGRVFLAEEDQRGRDAVIVLSHGLWERRFGSDPRVVGRTVTLDGVSRTVLGVLPSGVRFDGEDLYVPLALRPDSLRSRGNKYLTIVGRLARGATLAQSQAELNAIARRLRQEFPDYYAAGAHFGITVVPLREVEVGTVRPALLVLFAAVGLLLLIACANVASMLLARAAAREREISVRVALGASRARVVRQLLTESTVLALAGGGAGLLAATWGVKALLAVGQQSIPRAERVGVDATVAVVTLAVTLATGILFGLAPALQATRGDLHSALKEASRGSAGSTRQRLRRLLVVAEVALAVVVVIGAGLLAKSFWRLRRVDPGFVAERVLALDLSLPRTRYADSSRVPAFFDQLLERLRALPGVEAAAAVSQLPLTDSRGNWDVEIEGRPVAPGEPAPSPDVQTVTPEYLRVMRVAVVRGRDFSEHDDARAPLVALVNETMARMLWPGQDPVGRRFRLVGTSPYPWVTVVGVARDVKQVRLSDTPRAQYYFLEDQLPVIIGDANRSMTVVVRTTGDPASLGAWARRVVWSLDPELAVANVRTMEQVVAASVAQPRFTMLLLATFGAAALALASIGIYGVMSYAVVQRRREMGIRMALGAQAGHVLRLVVGQGMRLALVGVAIGVAASMVATRLLAKLLYGVSATDPATFTAIVLLLGGVALAASYLPASRATRVDPATALRAE